MSTHDHDHDHDPEHDHTHDHEADGFVYGHEVLGLLAGRGGRLPVTELKGLAAAAFGTDALYGNCHGDRFDFEGLLDFLSSVGKLARVGSDVALGRVPGCSGH